MRRGPRWSQSEGGPLAHAAGAPVVPKRRRPPRPCGGGRSDPKAKEASSPMRRGPRLSQSEGGPLTHAVGASVVPKRRRPPHEAPSPRGGGLGGPKAKEASSPMRRQPRWSQSEGGPFTHAAGASVVPKRRRPPRPCGGGLGGPKTKEARSPRDGGLGGPQAKEAPSPIWQGPRWSQNGRGPLAHAAGAAVTPKRKRPPRSCSRGLGVT